MYQPFSEQCIRVMTAAKDNKRLPPLDAIRDLPAIKMSIAESHSTSEKLQQGALEVLRRSAFPLRRGFIGFERQVPDVVTGQNQDWYLWRVDFHIARLRLYYADMKLKDPSCRLYGTSPDSVDHFRSCVYAYLISPASIGLDFTIPELDWRINCEMVSSSPTGAHSIVLAEYLNGERVGHYSLNASSVPDFVPEER